MNRGRRLLIGIDPRVKLAWLLATLVAGVIFADPVTLAVILASILVVAAIGGVLVASAARLRGLAPIIVVIAIILGFTVPGEPLLAIGPLAINREGLLLGAISAIRIFIFAWPLVVITMTTSNSDLLQGLMSVRVPADFALMFVLALNFVPLYIEEFGRIADAQRARAHALVEQGIVGKLRGLVPIFIPLTLNAIDRADTIGKVLEIRGFARRKLQVEFEPMTGASWVLLAASVALLSIAMVSVAAGRDLIAAALGRS